MRTRRTRLAALAAVAALGTAVAASAAVGVGRCVLVTSRGRTGRRRMRRHSQRRRGLDRRHGRRPRRHGGRQQPRPVDVRRCRRRGRTRRRPRPRRALHRRSFPTTRRSRRSPRTSSTRSSPTPTCSTRSSPTTSSAARRWHRPTSSPPARSRPPAAASCEITQEGDVISINGGEATVVCGGIPVANGYLYIIDSVLQPPSSDVGADGSTSSPSSSGPDVTAVATPGEGPAGSAVRVAAHRGRRLDRGDGRRSGGDRGHQQPRVVDAGRGRSRRPASATRSTARVRSRSSHRATRRSRRSRRPTSTPSSPTPSS